MLRVNVVDAASVWRRVATSARVQAEAAAAPKVFCSCFTVVFQSADVKSLLPLHDRVLVERFNPELKSKGGIMLPEKSQGKVSPLFCELCPLHSKASSSQKDLSGAGGNCYRCWIWCQRSKRPGRATASETRRSCSPARVRWH